MISADRVRVILAEIRKLPYITLYLGDWMKDSVSGVSLTAQMLWMRMMFVMHDAPVYGHLVDAKGRPLDEARLIRMCGARTATEYRRALAELWAAGVPSETGDDDYNRLFVAQISGEDVDLSPMRIETPSVIYSRRMVRDHRLRVVRRLVGELGTPNRRGLVPQTENVLVPQTGQSLAGARAPVDNDNDSDSRSPSQIHQKPEGVQGEGRAPMPDFEAAKRVYEKLKQSALKEIPPEQVAVGLVTDFGEELVLETLIDCENEYSGKPWRYFEKILTDRLHNPAKRPGQRRKQAGGGNGRGRRDDHSASAEKAAAIAANPLGNFGMRSAEDVIPELEAKRKLQEMQRKPA